MNHLSEEQLNRYLDDALDPPARAVVERHLAGCTACRRELAALQEVFASLAALPPAPLPAGLVAPVLARITPRPRPRIAARIALVLQLVATLGLLAWQWATLAAGLTAAQGWLAIRIANLQGTLAARAASTARELQALQAGIERLVAVLGDTPLNMLTPLQWGVALAIAAVCWLLGTRLALSGPVLTEEHR